MMQFKLPVSMGAIRTKWIAKLATSAAKPYGVRVVHDDEIESFINDIPIGEFPGVGKAYSLKMERYGIKTIKDAWKSQTLMYSWGKGGERSLCEAQRSG